MELDELIRHSRKISHMTDMGDGEYDQDEGHTKVDLGRL
jgi:hypothetical protein